MASPRPSLFTGNIGDWLHSRYTWSQPTFFAHRSFGDAMIAAFPKIDPFNWNEVQPHLDALLAADLTPATARDWLQEWSDLASVIDEANGQAYRAITENTKDEAAGERFRKLVSEILPLWAQAEQALKQKLVSLEGYEPTPETDLILKRFRAEVTIFRDENVPIISELRLQSKRYAEIIGGLGIEWQGERKTVPQAEVLLGLPDRAERERVWRAIMSAYLGQRTSLNSLFLEMLERRRRLARNAGFADFRSYYWQVLGRFDYTPDDCQTFRDAIEHEVVPLATELYERRKNELGLDSLRPWELGINDVWALTVDTHPTPLRPFASTAELEDLSQSVFDHLHPDFGKMFMAQRDGYLDLDSRANKAPGGYCEGLPVSGQAYIFMNAAGSHDNFKTMLHEGGHAFHFAESYRAQSLVWNYNAPMEFCEVASIGMEFLSTPYWRAGAGGVYSEADYRRAMADKLSDPVFFLCYMAVMDGIQHWLYSEAPADVDTDDIDRKWSELWDRFLPGIDYSGLETEKATGWHRKGHIFSVPFYYVEYGLANVGALQIWRNALTDEAAAVAAYRRALAAGNTRTLPELFALAGARFAFDRATLAELMALVRQQIAGSR